MFTVNIMALFSFYFSPYHHHRYFAFTFFCHDIILVSINSILNFYNFHFFTSIHFTVNYLINIIYLSYTVEPPRKGHFGTNINSSGLSPLERLSSFKRFQSHYIDREG